MDLRTPLEFLARLAENNNREWFTANRGFYDSARGEFLHLVAALVPALRAIDSSIGMVEPENCLFRIFRDVRFSKDKSPYKTNFGAFIANGGRKSPSAGYYVHMEPGSSFVGGGAYMPAPPYLKAIRSRIFDNPREYREIIFDPGFKSCFGGIFGERLKSAPRNFPKDFAGIDLLKNRHYAVTHQVADGFWSQDEGLLDEIVAIYRLLEPFNRFLNQAIATVSEP
ncbi:TIGR02453 family protein [Prosthecochloris sp. GSB1]|uniref:DUF2461 domain-containing protein n=1 Tax=Prosthecochloris sp. GSB1 TaxID=281093 RepID=UPI000B8CBF48|nr:DUF2461 domain-containing protein [Prosthecochloris sp. GSB1]ASQ91410.1 TIGR02453 family protein [Prosthecochloris sp. GSB1]